MLADRADEDEALAAIRAGAQDYLVKSTLYPALLRRALRYAIERKRSEVRLAHLALHDPLTGLPNRALFLDRLGVALDRSRRTNATVAVLFLDVDNFKSVNDSLGHGAGDQLLVGLADRLRAMLRPMDTVARFGGDEFTFLFEDLAGEREVVLIAERIGRIAGMPLTLEQSEISITVSIGITIVADPTIDGRDGDPRGRRGDVPGQGARPRALRAVRRELAPARARADRARVGAAAERSTGPSCGSTTSRRSRSTGDRRHRLRGARALAAPRARV